MHALGWRKDFASDILNSVYSVRSPDELSERLSATGYLSDDGLATIGYLALTMQRPLLLEGEPGRARRTGRGTGRGARPAADPAAVP